MSVAVERDNVCRRLESILDAMGSTPDEVRTTIESTGIKGEPISPRRCPVARYLGSQGFGDSYDLVTTYSKVIVWWSGTDSEHQAQVPIPEPVRGFIEKFDQGLYPWLIDNEGRP